MGDKLKMNLNITFIKYFSVGFNKEVQTACQSSMVTGGIWLHFMFMG